MVLLRFSMSPSTRFVQIPCRIGFHIDGCPAKKLALPFCPCAKVQPFFYHKSSRPVQYSICTIVYYRSAPFEQYSLADWYGSNLAINNSFAAFGVKKGSLEISVISSPLAPFFASSEKRLPGSRSILSCPSGFAADVPEKRANNSPNFNRRRRRFRGKKTGLGRKHARRRGGTFKWEERERERERGGGARVLF